LKTRGPLTWKQRDLTRALKGAVAAGLPPRKASVAPDGRIELDFDGGTVEVEASDWDEILQRDDDEAA
jgi:hypothetical protein